MVVCVATEESVLGGLGSTIAGAGLTELNLEEKEKHPEGEIAYGDGVKGWCRKQERCTQPLGMDGVVSKIPSLGNKDRTPAYEIVKKQLKCQIKDDW